MTAEIAINRETILRSKYSVKFSSKSALYSDEKAIRKAFMMFNGPRTDRVPKFKNGVRNHILETFKVNGFETFVQDFRLQSSNDVEGKKLIGVWPGHSINKTDKNVLLIGAHYDTVEDTPGIDDNGSGCVALMEIVRLVGFNKPEVDHKIFVVAFDHEESVRKQTTVLYQLS